MHKATRRSPFLIIVDFALSFTLVFSPLLVNAASPPAAPPPASGMSPTEGKEFVNNINLLYWAKLDHEMPQITEAFLGGPKEEVARLDNTPLVDADPFFMRSQSWSGASSNDCPASEICSAKSGKGLQLTVGGSGKILNLDQAFTAQLNTRDYIILNADHPQIFADKTPGSAEVSEGFFFINKADLKGASASSLPVPVFFFALPGNGWTGKLPPAMELEITDQVVLVDNSHVPLSIERSDIAIIEQIGRSNLILAQTATFLEGRASAQGATLPKPYSTAAFGMVMSGLMPNYQIQTATRSHLNGQFQRLLAQLGQAIVPPAQAEGESLSRLQKLRQAIVNKVKPWIAPILMYGGTAVGGFALYDPVIMDQMIPDNYATLVGKVGQMIAGVAGASIMLKYTLHRDYFKKKYPRLDTDGILQRLNKEHKGIMDELAHGLYFSIAAVPQGIRHLLEILKDRGLPTNHIVHRAWEATMGFQMRQNSRLAMNWKTQYLGWWHGLLDSTLVGVHLLILAPWLANQWGIGVATGAVAAAYASSEVLRNFLAYLQSGAHNYSAEIKMIHLNPAENEAKRKMQNEGLDPNSALNEAVLRAKTNEELARIYKVVGLPGEDEFLYDPISFLEWIVKKMGYSLDGLTEEQKKEIGKTNFVLSRRRWGLVAPALTRALNAARATYAQNPTESGKKTIELLQWAIDDRSNLGGVARGAFDVATVEWARDGLKKSVNEEIEKAKVESQGKSYLRALAETQIAGVKGALKYFAQDATQDARDIKKVIFISSSSTPIEDVTPYLPASWIKKAGSPTVARAGAELIRRAFFALYEGKPQDIQPATASDKATYGARANRILDRLAVNDVQLRDAFFRSLAFEELVSRLKVSTQNRQAILNYKPPAASILAAKQWETVRSQTETLMRDVEAQEPTSPSWTEMVNNYNNNVETKAETSEWARAYQYRFIVAQQMAKKLGLAVESPEGSAFVQKVVVKAALHTEGELAVPAQIAYMNTLKPADREFYQAKLFYRHFVATYAEMSVQSDEHMDATTPAYPGRFQAIRRWAVGARGGKVVSAVVRTVEALFRNESTSYLPGFWSWVDRSVPLLPDMYHNFWRGARALPYMLSLSYLTSYYLWHIHTPYSIWLTMGLFMFIHPTLVEINTRLMKNFGIKPMENMASKAKYSFVHSNMTNIEPMIVQNHAGHIQTGFETYVTGPIKMGISSCADVLKRMVPN